MTREEIFKLEAGEKMDALIMQYVYGLHWIPSGKPKRTHMIEAQPIPDFSRSSEAALNLAISMRVRGERGFYLALDNRGGDPWWAEFASGDYGVGAQATASTAPLAICRAALLAVLTEKGEIDG